MRTSRLAIFLVAIILVTTGSAYAQAKRDKASPALQKEYSAFMEKFRAGLRANDVAAVTAMTRFPYFWDNAHRDAAFFRTSVYSKIFTPRVRDCVQRGRGVYDKDGLNNDNFFVFCGQLIVIFTKTPQGFLMTETGVND